MSSVVIFTFFFLLDHGLSIHSHAADVEDLRGSPVASVERLDVWTGHVLVALWASPLSGDLDSSIEEILNCLVGVM